MVATSLGDLVSIVPQDQSLHKLQQVLDGFGVWVGQPKACLWARVVTSLVSQGPWGTRLSKEMESAP